MTRDQIQAQGLEKIRKMSKLMIIGFAVIVMAAIIAITAFTVSRYDELTKAKVGSMTSTLNVQLKLNLESYLSRMETIGTLAYSVDNAYSYDASDASNDEYEAINTEKQIAADLGKLCLMENFVDYGIVYANNSTVGKISNGTIKLFGDRLYTDLSAMVNRDRTHDGWNTGYNGDYDRIYYVKRMHENAVLVISFYTEELDSVFENPENLSDMEIRLTDSNYNMIYSSVKGDICGQAVPERILSDVRDKDMMVINGSENLSTVNGVNDDWFIVCSIPEDVILKETVDIRKYIYIAAALAAIAAAVAGAVFIRRMADPVGTVTSSLSKEISEDGFENVLGRRFFRDKADNLMKKDNNQSYAVVIAAINNYGDILEKFDPEVAEVQVARLVENIGEVFTDVECIGRVSDNAFSVLIKNVDMDQDGFFLLTKSRAEDLCEMFKQTEYTNTMGSFDITVSVGTAVGSGDYSSIYNHAYKALSRAVNSNSSLSALI
ncbi:MAG: diguanylate cyclase [Ruminococcus flavefaciens]